MEFDLSHIDLKQEATQRERIYFAVILVLIVIVFARWFYIPKMGEIKRAKTELTNLTMQVDQLKRFAEIKIPETLPAARPSAIVTSRFNKAVEASTRPKQEVASDVMGALTSRDAMLGLSLSGVSFAEDLDRVGYVIAPMTIEMDGKYSGVMNYLARMERLDHLVTADNIDLTSSAESPSIVHARIGVSIYAVRSAEEQAALEARQKASQPSETGGK